MPNRTFSAVLHREGDWSVAACPEIGTVSQGKTIEAVLTLAIIPPLMSIFLGLRAPRHPEAAQALEG